MTPSLDLSWTRKMTSDGAMPGGGMVIFAFFVLDSLSPQELPASQNKHKKCLLPPYLSNSDCAIDGIRVVENPSNSHTPNSGRSAWRGYL